MAKALAAFYAGPGKHFRVALDDTCIRPHDWTAVWHAPPIPSFWDADQAALERRWWGEKYGAAGFIPHMVRQTEHWTDDWRAADAILVILFVHQYSGLPEISQQQCLQRLRHSSESFRATGGGARHFFVLTGDNGPCCVDGRYKDVDFMRHRIIGNHGQRGFEHVAQARLGIAPPLPCFDPRKDISIPTPSVHSPQVAHATTMLRAPANVGGRPLLLFAVGENRYSRCRLRLVALFEHSNDSSVLIRRSLPTNETARHQLRAKFCPICSGFSPWTQRLPEALSAGCVPIIVRERWALPFDEVLDYSSFAGEIHFDDLASLPEYARSLDHERLQRNVFKARTAMRYELGPRQSDLSAHASGEHDMLPLLLFEMWRRLRTPLPDTSYVRAARSSILTDLNYSASFKVNASGDHAEKHLVDSMMQLNESYSFMNASYYRCWSLGTTCECGRAAPNQTRESRLGWNYRHMKPPKGRFDESLDVVQEEQVAWRKRHRNALVGAGGES